jgi:hypothetical protein
VGGGSVDGFERRGAESSSFAKFGGGV